MSSNKFSVSAKINSSSKVVYAIIADYRDAHPKILPKPPFVSLIVEQGGIGVGTIVRVQMKVLGKIQKFRTVVTEPEPGRVLVETNDTGYITTFTVESIDDGKNSFVTFTTGIPDSSGLFKNFVFRLTKLMLTPVYKQELENLAQFAAKHN